MYNVTMLSRRLCLLALTCLLAGDAYSQARSIGGHYVRVDDNTGNTITMQTWNTGWVGDRPYVIPIPPASLTRTGYLYHGTVVGQTAYFDGNFWIPSNILTNTGTDLGVNGNIVPGTAGAHDLGSALFPFDELFVNNLNLPPGSISPSDIALPNGNIIVGDVSGFGSAVAAGAANTVLVSNGTTPSYQLLSGASMSLVEGSIFVGNALNVATQLAIGAINTLAISNGTTLAYGLIANNNIAAAAAIDGTKINPNFGTQNITTTGKATTASTVGADPGNTLTTKDYVDAEIVGALDDAVILTPTSSTRNRIQPSGDFVGVSVRGTAGGQTVNLAEFLSTGGATVASVSASGAVSTTQLAGAGTVSDPDTYAGWIDVPAGTISITINYSGVLANSTILVTFRDAAALDFPIVNVTAINPGVSFTAMLSTPNLGDVTTDRLYYLVVNP